MSDHNGRGVSALPAYLEAAPYERRANSALLERGSNGHRRECDCSHNGIGGLDRQLGEKDVANDAAVDLRYKRCDERSFFAEHINQPRLFVGFECGCVNVADDRAVGCCFLADGRLRMIPREKVAEFAPPVLEQGWAVFLTNTRSLL